MFQSAITGSIDNRVEPRAEVYHRTRATMPDRQVCSVLIVNVSASGLMLRSDALVTVGDRIQVMLPTAGEVAATVRWALGGRLGCQFDAAIPGPRYAAVLAKLDR